MRVVPEKRRTGDRGIGVDERDRSRSAPKRTSGFETTMTSPSHERAAGVDAAGVADDCAATTITTSATARSASASAGSTLLSTTTTCSGRDDAARAVRIASTASAAER